MRRILKHLVPYWRSVLIIIIFLIVQSVCDLSLPTYTSKLIDTGIQNGGVEHILPEAITAEEYGQAQLFMTDEEKALFTGFYTIDGAASGAVYTLAVTDEDQLSAADETLLTPIVLTYQLGHMDEDSFKEMLAGAMAASPQMAAYADQLQDMSLEEIAAVMPMAFDTFEVEDEDGTVTTYVDVRSMLSAMMASGMMDETTLSASRDQLNTTIESIGSTTLKSMGIQYAVACDKAAGLDMDQVQMDYLWSTARVMFMYAVLMLVCAIVISYVASKAGAGVGRDLRERIYRRVISFSNAEINQFSSASLITRATNDVQQIQMVSVFLLRVIFYAPILGVGGVILVARSGASMWWIIALAVLLLLGFVGVLVAVAMPKFKIMQERVDAVNLVSREILTGLSVIRAFGRERREEERFDKVNLELKDTQLFTSRTMTFMMPGMTLIMNGIVVLIMWVAAGHIEAGTMQVGALTAFITYTMLIVMSFLMLAAMSILLPRASVAAERIDAVLETETSIKDTDSPVQTAGGRGVIRFEHVSFHYPDAGENVLEDIDFTAEPGQVTAIIGSTGCGKSTLVNLIPRFYDVTEGRITLDGVDIQDLSLKDLRAKVGFVPQKGVLFSGTIASNLKFADKDMADDRMVLAARIAQAEDFISEKEEGYDSYIAQGGANVSGGQKQRLAIARAIAKDPLIYVFDDSFSALDMKTDANLRKALEAHVKDAAQIIVAQRISTILHADQILVLEDGRVVGKGRHEDLLKTCPVYLEIAKSQLSARELGLAGDGADAAAAGTPSEAAAQEAMIAEKAAKAVSEAVTAADTAADAAADGKEAE